MERNRHAREGEVVFKLLTMRGRAAVWVAEGVVDLILRRSLRPAAMPKVGGRSFEWCSFVGCLLCFLVTKQRLRAGGFCGLKLAGFSVLRGRGGLLVRLGGLSWK